jgi:5-methylcytosine-specific restriction endonuclease McrA
MTAMADVMDSRVLVLNKNWQAVNVTKARKAIHKVINGRALFIDPLSHVTYDWEDWVLNWDDAAVTAKRAAGKVMPVGGIFEMVVPEVIVCTEYGERGFKVSTRRPKFSRTNVYRRDRNRCQYCGKKFKVADLTLDHVMPKSKGGEMVWENIVLACFPCNSKKDNRTPKQAGMRLIREPFRPKAGDLVINPLDRLRRKVGDKPVETWEQFLGKMYWEVELKDE